MGLIVGYMDDTQYTPRILLLKMATDRSHGVRMTLRNYEAAMKSDNPSDILDLKFQLKYLLRLHHNLQPEDAIAEMTDIARDLARDQDVKKFLDATKAELPKLFASHYPDDPELQKMGYYERLSRRTTPASFESQFAQRQ